MKMTIKCNICSHRMLHIYTENNFTTRQCTNCGYSSNDKLKGKMEDNEFWNNMSDFIKKYSKEDDNHIWIPTLLTLPFGSLYPIEENNKLKWAYAKLVDVSEEEKDNFKKEDGSYFTKKLDTDNPETFSKYSEGMVHIRNSLQEQLNG
jgi:Zn ribbon nucleic-acid-binding protein